jgi:hypothetical protein
MDILEFEVKTSTKTKYGFNLHFTYYVNVKWFYKKCKIIIKTYYHKKIIYETIVSEERYNTEIDNIKTLMEDGKYKDILVKDFERCVACKTWIDKEDQWVYEEYDMFCSYICMKKPIADKCCICKKDISRRYDWQYSLHCSIFCALVSVLKTYTILPIDIISNIANKIV